MSTMINLSPETAVWGGGLPREGVVVEIFVPSLVLGCSGPLGVFKKFVQKSLCKKKFVLIFFPYNY